LLEGKVEFTSKAKGEDMKSLLMGAVMLAISAPYAFAQSASSGPQSPAATPANSNSSQNLAAVQKIRQDLQNAGFTDVKVVAESFVVQAKSKDGDPVLMTIGPHGMSVFEAMNTNNSGSTSSSTTGTANGTTTPGPKSQK
jgi:hypothetical protein